MAKRVQVVLNEDVLSLGRDGDLVEVAPGYARNFLLPFGKAVPVTPAVMKQVEHRRAKEAERQAALKQEALAFRTALDTIGRFTVKKQTGGDEVLFGTVTNGDVAEAIEAATKKEVDRRDITVPDIHRTGSYKVKVKLHSDVTAEINLEVVSY
ncbi:50S ribosomal protein L9 [Synechococcus sp. RS9909]|uniref:50S ribosomal protein L9 n=1 Tax=unclassified Synechococcus TaxID=2626047 RepID=UPI000069063C|nr:MULTISPECIES: 50S ribosomal protein L9 [unclassified Synechococcus]ATW00010.1 50S ribosomal protein L9 [Synechococcus sp. RS9909]EAQ70436.1 50S ribosomal protein L9 [Synechococcus sp. RS9917]QNI80694.1 50S ribosomal protein L9 [Synechococcus sp. RS9909]